MASTKHVLEEKARSCASLSPPPTPPVTSGRPVVGKTSRRSLSLPLFGGHEPSVTLPLLQRAYSGREHGELNT